MRNTENACSAKIGDGDQSIAQLLAELASQRPSTAAGRWYVISELLCPTLVDEDGEVYKGAPLITLEDAIALVNAWEGSR